MPAFTEWFCDFCNASCQRRDPGDEVNTGYIRMAEGTGMPRAWFKVEGSGDRIACGRCPHTKLLAASREQRARLVATGEAEAYGSDHSALAAVAALAGSAPGTTVRGPGVTATNTEGDWPSRTSPFAAQPSGVERPNDKGVRTDGE